MAGIKVGSLLYPFWLLCCSGAWTQQSKPPSYTWLEISTLVMPSHPKLQVFLWKITQGANLQLRGALPKGANLQLRGLQHNTSWPHCGELETISHLFLYCAFAKRVWSSTILSPHFDPDSYINITAFTDALKACKTSACLPPIGIISDIFPWICWEIWTARNKLIFEDWRISPEETVSRAIRNAREWNSAQAPSAPPSWLQSQPLSIPDLDALTLGFSDTAWSKESNTAAFGCIFQNREGQTIHHDSRMERNVSSPLVAEALALRWTIITALSKGFLNTYFNTDCKSLVTAISSQLPPAVLFGIIQDIDILSTCFSSISFKFIASC